MSVEPVRHPSFHRPKPLRPGRVAAPAPANSAMDASRAQSLLPRVLLRGCREAVQRISAPDPRSYGITSSIRGEGRSSVAVGMALVEWLDYGRRTVLVDLDLEHPSLHRRLGLAEGPGISELAAGHDAIEDHLQRVAGDVWLLSAGRLGEEAPRTLTRLAQNSVISQLTEWADAVVFDLPPLLGSPSGLQAARLCGSPVLLVRAGVTPLTSVKEASEILPVPPPVVLNGVRSALPRWIQRATGNLTP